MCHHLSELNFGIESAVCTIEEMYMKIKWYEKGF